MLRINRKEQSAPAHCSWYVFILGGVAIHLTVCMPCVCVCEGPRRIQHVYAYITSHDGSTIEWLPMGIESMFITESVSADQRLPLRQSMLFLFQLGQISCHPAPQMLLFRSVWIYEKQIICMSQVQRCAKEDLSVLLFFQAAALRLSHLISGAWWCGCKCRMTDVI